ncbi:MAG TPA: hypothetical protein IAC14_08930 [Candidatus Scybalomonas excrementigallinarum]|nr:hypothetical protein [Candidatus Scybalomonas excrementigallinarum]
MKNFLEEKEKLLNSIENNTPKHWKEYYKDVPLDCIFEDLVIDINEIKRLTEENEQLKQQLEQRDNIINKAREKIKLLGKFDGKTCTRGFQMWVADFNNLLEILNIDKGDE